MASQSELPVLLWLAHAIDAVGIDLEHLQLSERQKTALLTTDAAAPPPLFEDYLAILDAAALATGDSEVGIAIGRHIDPHETGLLGYILPNTATIGDLLTAAARYHTTVTDSKFNRFWSATRAFLVQGQHVSRFQYEINVPHHSSAKHDIALLLTSRTTRIRSHISPDWQPELTGFSFPKPQSIEKYRQQFGRNVLFDQDSNFFDIQNDHLETHIGGSNPPAA